MFPGGSIFLPLEVRSLSQQNIKLWGTGGKTFVVGSLEVLVNDTPSISTPWFLIHEFLLWKKQNHILDTDSEHMSLPENLSHSEKNSHLAVTVTKFSKGHSSPNHSNQRGKRNKSNPNWKGRNKIVTVCRWHHTLHRKPSEIHQKTARAHQWIW